MTPSHLAAVRAACQRVIDYSERATDAPWEADNWETTVQSEHQIVCVSTTSNRTNDTPFIALSRNLSPALVRAVLGELDYWEQSQRDQPNIQAQARLAAICAAFPEEIL